MMFGNSSKVSFLKRVFLTAIGVLIAVSAHAQSEKVNLPSMNMTVEDIVVQIERQTKFCFVYNSDIFDTNTDVSFNSQEMTLDDVISKMLEGKGLEYIFKGNYIVVNRSNNTSKPLYQMSRTGDMYKRSNTSEVDEFYASKGYVPVPEAVLFDTIVKPGEILPYPDPFSDYKLLGSYMNYPDRLPKVAVKTNLLYTATTFTPNLALEFSVGERSTIELSGSYNWQGRKKNASLNHKQKVHMIVRPEYRYWFCERFNGHYVGGHALYFKYNVSGMKVPFLFKKDKRYEGNAVGAGFTYGYHWAFAKRWGLDVNAGLGYMYMKHDEFTCAKCDTKGVSKTKNYFGPTRAGVSLVFMIR